MLQTEAKIFGALEKIVLAEGWDAVSVARVAKQAGLSVGAIYSRSENHQELANNLWSSRLQAALEDRLSAVLGAAHSGNADALQKAFANLESHEPKTIIGLELLLASLFQPDMAEVIGSDFSKFLAKHINTEANEELQRHNSAVNMLVLSFAFGRLLALRAAELPPLSKLDAEVLVGYPSASPRDLDAPPVEIRVRNISDSPKLSSAEISALLRRLEKSGYSGATVSRLARSAGLTPGELFGRFGSKESLIAEICHDSILPPGQVWLDYMERSGDADRASVRARFMKDFLSEDHRGDWRLTLELARVSKSVPALKGFRTPPDNLQRTHTGVMLIATFFPKALNRLPFLGPFESGVAT